MKNDSCTNIYGWLEISYDIDDKINWIRKYVELNRRKRVLTFYNNECIRPKEAPLVDLNSEMNSLSSSSLSSISSFNKVECPSINLNRSNCMLQSLTDYISPSLSNTIYSSSLLTDQKIDPLIPFNKQSNSNCQTSFTDSSSDRPSSITTTNIRQSKTKFSNFFGRSSNITINSLKRTKSVTKLERQKRNQQANKQSSLLNILTNRSRSHESLLISNGPGNGPLGSILPAKPIEISLDNSQIRHLHPSIFQSNDDQSSYQFLSIQNQNKNYYLRSNEKNFLFNHLKHKNMNGIRTDNSLDIWILEAKGLPTKKKYYVKIFLDDDIYGKTTSKEKRDILFWGENFIFKDLPGGCSTLRCKIYRDNERRKQKHDTDLIGYVNIPLSNINGNQFIEQWYPFNLINSKDKSIKSHDNSFNIRIKAKYQSIDILTIQSYSHLQQYIQRDYLRLIRILEPFINLRDKDELATSLTRIAQCLSYSTEYLVDIVQSEILSTSDNTLTFRGNSIATKSMEAYMKLIGETYLRETLKRFVTDIVSSKETDFEVDPDRVVNIQNLEKNQITLRLLCEKIWSEIQQSHYSFPQELKRIFSKLRQLSSSDETMFNLISGSVFLRFICPAILSPNLFGLTQEYPNERASRKLTLIAKTLQTLANFSKFGPKESYMKFMNDFVSKESDNMRRFLANLSTIHDEYEETELILDDVKCDIDIGREYSILHSTLSNLFEEIDLNIRQSLNELEYILNQLTNIKLFYFSTKIHFHHHHHHIYHHLQENSSSPYQNLNRIESTNNSLSNSSTLTNIQNVNKENFRSPLSFKNPLYNLKDQSQHFYSDLSDNDDDQQQSKQLYFFNNLSIQSNQNPTLIHSTSQQSLQQPLFILNNSYREEDTKNLSSSNIDLTSTTLNLPYKTNENISRRKLHSSNQQLPPKMGVKALNHTPANKDLNLSPILSLYQEEKCRRIQCEKQTERLRIELERSKEELKEYRQIINLINERLNNDYSDSDDDDDSKPIEKDYCLYNDTENKFIFLYSYSTDDQLQNENI